MTDANANAPLRRLIDSTLAFYARFGVGASARPG
jgi:hypothetical protein